MTPSYIGFDVHEATITAAVRDCTGKLVMEAILETKAVTRLPPTFVLASTFRFRHKSGVEQL